MVHTRSSIRNHATQTQPGIVTTPTLAPQKMARHVTLGCVLNAEQDFQRKQNAGYPQSLLRCLALSSRPLNIADGTGFTYQNLAATPIRDG